MLGRQSPRPDRFGPSTLVESSGHCCCSTRARVPIRLWQCACDGQIDALFITHYIRTNVDPDIWLTGCAPSLGCRTTHVS